MMVATEQLRDCKVRFLFFFLLFHQMLFFNHSKSFMISLFTISTTFIGFYEYFLRIYVRVNGCELPHKLGTLQ